MNVEIHSEPLVRPRFVGPHDDVSEPPARVIEYIRLPQTARSDSRLPAPASVEAIRAHSRLPPWLFRLLLAWGVLTLVSLVGPCRPLSPSPSLAAEASP